MWPLFIGLRSLYSHFASFIWLDLLWIFLRIIFREFVLWTTLQFFFCTDIFIPVATLHSEQRSQSIPILLLLLLLLLRNCAMCSFLSNSLVLKILCQNWKENAVYGISNVILNGYRVNAYSGRQSQMAIDQLIVTAPIVAFMARTWGREIYFMLFSFYSVSFFFVSVSLPLCVCVFVVFWFLFSTTMISQTRYLYFIQCTCMPAAMAIYVHRKVKLKNFVCNFRTRKTKERIRIRYTKRIFL